MAAVKRGMRPGKQYGGWEMTDLASALEQRSSAVASLFHEQGGWALGDVIAWLLTRGCRISEPTRFVGALCRRLVDAGAPLCRVRISFHTIHPQVAACAFTWVRGHDSTEFCFVHNSEAAEEFLETTARLSRDEDLRPFRYLCHLDPELSEMTVAGGIDYVVRPMTFSTGLTNVLVVATDSANGYSDSDIVKFDALAAFLCPVLEVISTRRVARTLLDTYLGRRTGGKVLDGLVKRGDGETIRAALWFSDLRDFTLLTETLAPQAVLSMLNCYFELVASAVAKRGGEVLRFIGDAMLIVFPAQTVDEDIDDVCEAALEAAIGSFDDLESINRQRAREGEPLIRFGVGLHVGEVIYGNVGAPDRLDFTVMGSAVNRVARLEDLTKEVGAALLMSRDFADRLGCPLRSLGCYKMKGVVEPQEVFMLMEDEALPSALRVVGAGAGD